MTDLKNESLEPVEQEQAQTAAEEAVEKQSPILESVKAKLDPIAENVKTKTEALMDKADPVIEKVKTAAGEAIDAVKDGAEKIGDFFSADAPVPKVKNELFDELEKQAVALKEDAKSKAVEMQSLLEKMMGGKD